MHKDKAGQVIYVGKAISLRNRVRQYFQSSKNMDVKVRAMVGHIAEFEYIRCGNEMEAFILENNLIKEFRPKYNVLLRDDKTYPYIKVTTSEKWPRILKTRIISNDGDKYFGPYSDAGAVNRMIEFLSDIYSLKKCSAKNFPKSFRPCLNYHIGRCDGICIGRADHREYMTKIAIAMDYLRGNRNEPVSYLKEKMLDASAKMEYEEARRYRDYMMAARALLEKQRVVLKTEADMDVVVPVDDEHIALFFVRSGKLTGRENYSLEISCNADESEKLGAFLRQYYSDKVTLPDEILVKAFPEDKELTELYLCKLIGRKVKLTVPRRGEKKALIDLACEDVEEMTKTVKERDAVKSARAGQLHEALGEIIAKVKGVKKVEPLEGKYYRMEAYDISNINGVDTVGAMVVFDELKKDKRAYRKFKLKTVEGPNDYGSIQEVLYRRFQRAQKEDSGFATLPDAVLIDGGKGHVAAALQVINAMGIDLPVLGMVKDDAHRTRALVYALKGESGGSGFEEINLPKTPLLFSFFGKIQEEVHRFAIEYHRNLRDKKALRSILDEVPGIGPGKRNALLRYFGSADSVCAASVEELVKVQGISPRIAEEVHNFFIAKAER